MGATLTFFRFLLSVFCGVFLLHAWFMQGFFYTSAYAKRVALDAVVVAVEAKGTDVDPDVVSFNESPHSRSRVDNPIWPLVWRAYSPGLFSNTARFWSVNICGAPRSECMGRAIMLTSGRVVVSMGPRISSFEPLPPYVPAPDRRR